MHTGQAIKMGPLDMLICRSGESSKAASDAPLTANSLRRRLLDVRCELGGLINSAHFSSSAKACDTRGTPWCWSTYSHGYCRTTLWSSCPTKRRMYIKYVELSPSAQYTVVTPACTNGELRKSVRRSHPHYALPLLSLSAAGKRTQRCPNILLYQFDFTKTAPRDKRKPASAESCHAWACTICRHIKPYNR
jgi:hypothetical protein